MMLMFQDPRALMVDQRCRYRLCAQHFFVNFSASESVPPRCFRVSDGPEKHIFMHDSPTLSRWIPHQFRIHSEPSCMMSNLDEIRSDGGLLIPQWGKKKSVYINPAAAAAHRGVVVA